MGDQEKPFNQKYPIGCNMAYQKSIFDKFGGFNEDLVLRSDEKDLFLRLKKQIPCSCISRQFMSSM